MCFPRAFRVRLLCGMAFVVLCAAVSLQCAPGASSVANSPHEPAVAIREEAAPETETNECLSAGRPPPPADVAELAALSRVSNLMISREQAAPAQPLRLEPFHLGTSATIRGFAHRFGNTSRLDAEAEGCEEQVMAGDGRLCPSVVYPGRELTAEQATRLRVLSWEPSPAVRVRCDFDPHHSFVAFDEQGVPTAHLRVCFECGEWSLNGAEKVPFPEGAGEKLAALCRDLGLGGCPAEPERGSEIRARYRDWLESGRPRRPSVELGILPETSLARLSPTQKRQLCAWRVLEAPRVDFSLEFESGETVRFQSYRECLQSFPACPELLGHIEAIDPFDSSLVATLTQTGGRCVAAAAASELAHCLWGIEVTQGGR